MQITLLAAESMGARSMCCLVTTKTQRIVIDPGVALDAGRFHLPPHPFQIAVAALLRQRILNALKGATDVVITHFHGDHTPLAAPDPYQVNAHEVLASLQKARIWAKSDHFASHTSQRRRKALMALLDAKFANAEGENIENFTFSLPFAHGPDSPKNPNGVMMARVQEGSQAFVFGSDIQLLNTAAVDQIVEWQPSVAYVSGPPLYIPGIRQKYLALAEKNLTKLAKATQTVIVDHHLMRSVAGVDFLKRLDAQTACRITSAAEYMGGEPMLLEALRLHLYRELPISRADLRLLNNRKRCSAKFSQWRQWDLNRLAKDFEI